MRDDVTEAESEAAGETESTDKAVLYRMVMPKHLCPFGLKSRHLLRQEGYEVEDHWLTTREETDAFKTEHGVKTTPQTFIDGRRIGGYEDLREFFGRKDEREDGKSYRPVLTIFAIAALLALVLAWIAPAPLPLLAWLERFVATSMVLLALTKLQDVESFSTMFLNYDLLARRWVPYGYVYPYVEAGAGLLMLAGVAIWLAAPAALFIGAVGAVSVAKAVWIDKRDLKCACVGGNSNVPLGFVSFTENVMMVAMGIWMPLRAYGVI